MKAFPIVELFECVRQTVSEPVSISQLNVGVAWSADEDGMTPPHPLTRQREASYLGRRSRN